MNEENDITQNNLLEVQEDVIIEKIPKNTDEFKIKKYKKVRILGRGGFALCYEVMDIDTNHSSAVKIIPKRKLIKSRAKQKLINEIKIHKSIQHEHIVNFEHYF